ncbi:transglutaminase domain-containing protein [archaeon]|jgi:transglutaminase-like putative cysteine protease|nr:transglutaminase domain-containing protein [archaeon]MBT4397781.1 transglutaminase domain-containing protein [archaeon]MBT4441115.1 transglutaminase domain-containing protein [archaeon]
MKKLLIIFILLLPLVCAQDYNSYETLNVEVNVENTVEVTSSGYDVSYFITELSFFPKDYPYQSVSNEITTQPQAEVEEDETITITWDENSQSYTFEVKSEVERRTDFVEIRNKIDFPLLEVDEEVLMYLEETEFIDINEDIEDKALEIVQGEDDLYMAVFKLADWTENNIEYDLNTMTSDAVQSSSWVLENKEGVCDELSNLFISFCRSMGIPARFVSGMAYTNLLDDFGAHGWAEVYIDGEWVPFDVTYGMQGWIDPSHIKFEDGVDSSGSSASFQWKGSNLDFDIGELEIDTDIVSAEGTVSEYVDISMEALYADVGEDSYVPVQVTVENDNNFYVPVRVAITKAPEVIGDNVQSILLGPNEEKNIFFIVKVNNILEENVIYTTHLEAETMYGGIAEDSFNFGANKEVITESDAEEMIALLSGEENGEVLTGVELDCSMDKEAYYSEEEGILTCEVDGSVDQICFGDDCQSDSFTWDLDMDDYNSQRYVVIAEKNEKVKYEYFDLTIVDKPEFVITIDPLEFDYGDTISFDFNLDSTGKAKNIDIDIAEYGDISVNEINDEYSFTLPIDGKRFAKGSIQMDLTYEDALGVEYSESFVQEVEVSGVPFYLKIVYFFENLF